MTNPDMPERGEGDKSLIGEISQLDVTTFYRKGRLLFEGGDCRVYTLQAFHTIHR